MKLSGPGSIPWAGLLAARSDPCLSWSEHLCCCYKCACKTHVHAHTHARTHRHTQLREELYATIFPGALWLPVVFSNLIFMNQVTKPTSNQAGERKQMLFQAGGVEPSSLSLWLNLWLDQGTAPCKNYYCFLAQGASLVENVKLRRTGKV